MQLCDNIFSLSSSMTRVEKYRKYREEISNMKFEDFSKKREASKQVEKIYASRVESKLNYEDVMVVHEVFDKTELKSNNKRLINLTKYEIFYFLIAIIFVVVIIATMVIISL